MAAERLWVWDRVVPSRAVEPVLRKSLREGFKGTSSCVRSRLDFS